MNVIKWSGKPIDKSGFYSHVPMSAYHSGRLCIGPSISSSGLRTIIQKSPAHYWDRCPINPDHDPKADEESEALILGRATHHLLLGQPQFDADFVLQPDVAPDVKGVLGPWNYNKLSCQKWRDDRLREGKTILTKSGVERVAGMAKVLSRQAFVQQGALNGEIELTIVHQDPATGFWILVRPDVVPTDSADIVDLKTTASILPQDIKSSIFEYGYFQQGALIADAYKAVTGQPIASFSLYFVESTRPFCCYLYRLHDDDLELGRRLNRMALDRLVKAMNDGIWPGPGGVQNGERVMRLSERHRELAEKLLVAAEGDS